MHKKAFFRLGLRSGQIGITAVLLTTLLLAVGVSVSNRVSKQIQNSTSRQESSALLNEAESVADIVSGGTTGVSETDTLQYITNATGDNKSVYLSEGESVEANLSGALPTIYWELGDPNAACDRSSSPAILLSHFKSDGTVDYYLLTGYNCTDGNRNGYTAASASNGDPYRNVLNTGTLTNVSGGTIRLKALYNNTYLMMDGLVTAARVAASNDAGNEVRIVEQQRTTTPAAPSVMDYAVFAGDGAITQ